MIYKKHCMFRNVAKCGPYFVISVKKWLGGFSFCCFDVTHDGDIPWGCTIFSFQTKVWCLFRSLRTMILDYHGPWS